LLYPLGGGGDLPWLDGMPPEEARAVLLQDGGVTFNLKEYAKNKEQTRQVKPTPHFPQ